MASVKLSNVNFSYPLYEIAGRSLKVTMMRQMVGAKLLTDGSHARVQALTDVSFELKEGDRLGLVGHNGSGKTSLLRILARLAHPQQGKVEIDGRVIPLIERGLGMNPELSGADNIELPLRMLGASTEEVRRAQEEIPEWTGLGPFFNIPVRTYSEGMKVRLMFALSTAISGDVLILDEWLGAGDAAFVERAQERLAQFISRTKILVLASHSLELIESACNKALWLERGEVRMMGSPTEVVEAYRQAMHNSAHAAE